MQLQKHTLNWTKQAKKNLHTQNNTYYENDNAVIHYRATYNSCDIIYSREEGGVRVVEDYHSNFTAPLALVCEQQEVWKADAVSTFF